MFKKIFPYLLMWLTITPSFSQIKIDPVSQDDLKIWSSDQYYLFEFYVQNMQSEEPLNFDIKSHNENTLLKTGIQNKMIDSLEFSENLCANESKLIRLFFKHIPGTKKVDSIQIVITQDTVTTVLNFCYKVVEEEDQLIKIFQSNFTKYMILDIDYGSIKEIVLYSKDRSQFKHIKSRTRLLDLSFLRNGAYILEINNEEYIINKM